MPAGSRKTFLVHVHPDDHTAVVEDVSDGGSARAGALSDIGPCISRLLWRRFARRPVDAGWERPSSESGDDSVRDLS